MDVRRRDEYTVGEQKVEFKNAEVNGQNGDRDGGQRYQQPVERLAARVAHAIDDASALDK